MLFVNMLDRERADFFRTLEQLKNAFGPHVGRDRDPDRVRARRQGVIDLVDMKAYRQDSADAGRLDARSRSRTSVAERRRSTARS